MKNIYRIHFVGSGAINMNAGANYQHLTFYVGLLFIKIIATTKNKSHVNF